VTLRYSSVSARTQQQGVPHVLRMVQGDSSTAVSAPFADFSDADDTNETSALLPISNSPRRMSKLESVCPNSLARSMDDLRLFVVDVDAVLEAYRDESDALGR
jgi:hypothetical protein